MSQEVAGSEAHAAPTVQRKRIPMQVLPRLRQGAEKRRGRNRFCKSLRMASHVTHLLPRHRSHLSQDFLVLLGIALQPRCRRWTLLTQPELGGKVVFCLGWNSAALQCKSFRQRCSIGASDQVLIALKRPWLPCESPATPPWP